MPAPTGHQASVAFANVAKHFGSTVALENFDLHVEPGEFLTLLGPSGSGKTTALNILAGFVDASSGDVLIGSKSVRALPPEARNIGMVFQNFALFPHMTVFDNVAFPLRMRAAQPAEVKHKVGGVLEMVKLSDLAARKPAELSGGQRQRVALARAVVFAPPVLLMDECLGALDLKLREELQGEIRRLHRELGTTVLFVTHDQGEALTMSDRVAVMEAGRIVQIDTPEHLYDHPHTRFVAEFIGQTNLFDAQASGTNRLTVPELGVEFEAIFKDGTTAISLRPERIHRAASVRNVGTVATFEAILEDVTFYGPIVARSARLPSGRVLELRESRSGDSEILAKGSSLLLAFKPEDAVPLPSVYEEP